MRDLRDVASLGLILSGGGVRGMAHIGVIRALNEYGISANIVSGSSVGALVGALYSNGNTVSEMLAFFKETPLFKYNFLTIVKPGFIDTDRYLFRIKTTQMGRLHGHSYRLPRPSCSRFPPRTGAPMVWLQAVPGPQYRGTIFVVT